VPIGSLPQEVRLFPLRCLLITAICRPLLLLARCGTAGLTTVALATVAMAAYIERGMTVGRAAETWSENRFGRCRIGRLDSALHLITIHRIDDDRTDDVRLRRR
jgi:hypothetical protein